MKRPTITATTTTTILLFLLFLALLSLSVILLSSSHPSFSPNPPNPNPAPHLKVFVADLPSRLNYGLLNHYHSLSTSDSRIPPSSDPDHRPTGPSSATPHYPNNPLIKQYSAEYWLLGDLESKREGNDNRRGAGGLVERVRRWSEADVVFVPFFATLSAELELGWGRKGGFGKKGEGNGDYERQKGVVELVTKSDAWRRSGGRDHVFVLTGNVNAATISS